MIQTRFEMDEYTVRVLDVIKGKFGLKNRNEALQKLALEAGSEYVEPTVNEAALQELDAIYESHKKKHGNKKISNAKLKNLLGL